MIFFYDFSHGTLYCRYRHMPWTGDVFVVVGFIECQRQLMELVMSSTSLILFLNPFGIITMLSIMGGGLGAQAGHQPWCLVQVYYCLLHVIIILTVNHQSVPFRFDGSHVLNAMLCVKWWIVGGAVICQRSHCE